VDCLPDPLDTCSLAAVRRRPVLILSQLCRRMARNFARITAHSIAIRARENKTTPMDEEGWEEEAVSSDTMPNLVGR